MTGVELCGLCHVPAGEGVCITCTAVAEARGRPPVKVLYDSGSPPPLVTLAEQEALVQQARMALRRGKRSVVLAGGQDVALGLDPTRDDGRYWARCHVAQGRVTRTVTTEGHQSSLDALSALAERVHAITPRRRR